MNQNKFDNSLTGSGAIETALATEEDLLPSSGFLASVMDRVHDEARTPSPIPFPWKRAVPGAALAVGVFGWAAVEFVRQAIPAVRTFSFSQSPISMPVSRPVEEAGWVALALVISLLSWLLSRRLAGQSGSL
jgi:hypothetical protein